MVRVTQSWDDGVHDDLRLMDIFRRHRATATFNLNPGRHSLERFLSWMYKGVKPVWKLSLQEVKDAYRDFEVASHSVTHPHLEKLSPGQLEWELGDSRKILEDWFQRPVRGFAYPFGSYDEKVKDELRRQGYAYARTVKNVADVLPVADPMEFHPNVHFLSPNFWPAFERAKATGGVFYFWGHSYEILDEAMWRDMEDKIARLSADPVVRWINNIDLFEQAAD